MGYFEYVCQLCGVSFAISRLRRVDEPEQAAWAYHGDDFVEATEDFPICVEESGCTMFSHDDRVEEHVAGPGCVCQEGYSGHQISLAEMKGCRTVQCLVRKTSGWMPEDGDQDFEAEGDYFLTGVGDGSSGQHELRNIEPARHGVNIIPVLNAVCSLPYCSAMR